MNKSFGNQRASIVDRKDNLENKNNISVSLLSITKFITPEDLEKLRIDIQAALELSISKRKAAMVAYKTGSISKEERKNYMLDPTTQAITSGITNFFDTYFSSHPEFDISKKDEIVDFYVKQSKLVTTALTAAKNPKEQEAAKEKIITTFLDSFENNPELRDIQIKALKDDLYVGMNDVSRIDLPVKGEKDLPHGDRTKREGTVGVAIILTEAIITGLGTTNGMSNAAFNHGWKELSTNGFVTSLPGATIAILSAMGGQAYVRYLLSIQEKGEKFSDLVRKKTVGTLGGLTMVLAALGGTGYLDYQMSKSGVGITAGTAGQVKGKTDTVSNELIVQKNKSQMTLAEQAQQIDAIVTTLLIKEEERGGKAIFYTTKYQVLKGTLQGITDTKYDTESKLTEAVSGLDTKKSTTLNVVRSNHKNLLSKLAYPSNSTLESTLRDTNISLSDKTKAIIAEYQSMYDKMLVEANSLSERASRPLNLESWSMVKLSNVGAFSSLDDAQQAILALGKLIDTYPAQFMKLNAIQKQLSNIYVDTIIKIEGQAKTAFVGTKFETNTLPDDISLDLPTPDISGIKKITETSLVKYEGISTDQAMVMVEKTYGSEVRGQVDKFIMWRSIWMIGLLIGIQSLLLRYSYAKRAGQDAEIEALDEALLKQIGYMTDTLHQWANSGGLQHIISSPKDQDVISRPFCEHIIWSWLIEQDNALRKFAPPTYLGEGEQMTGQLGNFGKYFIKLITCDIRPESDERTSALYKVFKKRIQDGELMTENDIENIVSQFGFTNGSNLVEDISKLNATLKSANTEYAKRSRDPIQADAIEKSRYSNLSKRDQEIKALQFRITEEHLAELDSMAQGMMAGNFPINQNEVSIDTEIELTQLKYDEELAQGTHTIDNQYDINIPLKAAKSPTTGFFGKWPKKLKDVVSKLWKSNDKEQEDIKYTPTLESLEEDNMDSYDDRISSEKMLMSMNSIQSGIEKHKQRIVSLQTPEGKDEFIQEVLHGDANLIKPSILESVGSIERYRELSKSLDKMTMSMQQEYSKMNPITEISGREDVLRKMNEIRVARNIQIENEGTHFSDWIRDITGLIRGLDALDVDKEQWEKKILVNEESTFVPLDPGAKGIAINNLMSAIRAKAMTTPYQLTDFVEGVGVELVIEKDGIYIPQTITRDGDTFHVKSIIDLFEPSKNISLEELNRRTNRK